MGCNHNFLIFVFSCKPLEIFSFWLDNHNSPRSMSQRSEAGSLSPPCRTPPARPQEKWSIAHFEDTPEPSARRERCNSALAVSGRLEAALPRSSWSHLELSWGPTQVCSAEQFYSKEMFSVMPQQAQLWKRAWALAVFGFQVLFSPSLRRHSDARMSNSPLYLHTAKHRSLN